MAQDFVAADTGTVNCTAGASPAVLSKLTGKSSGGSKKLVLVSDKGFLPTPAIFVMCSILAGPCVPVLVGNWLPGCTKLKSEGVFCAKNGDTLVCSVGGTLSIDSAGQDKIKAE